MTPAQKELMNTSAPSENKGGTAAAIDPLRLLRVYWPFVIGAVILGGVVGVAAFILLSRFAPVFQSQAVFQVQAPTTTTGEQIQSGVNAGGEGEEFEIFLATEVARARSEDLLRLVINEPTVRSQTEWINAFLENGVVNESNALESIEDVLRSSVVTNTANFMITARVGSATDAAIIADAARNVYLKDYRDRHNASVRELIRELEGQIRNLNEQISELDDQLVGVLADNRIQSVDNAIDSWTDELRNLNPAIVETNEQISLLSDQLEEYKLIDNREGPPVYPDSIREQAKNTPVVQRLLSEIAIQQGTTNAIIEQFGPNHPDSIRASGILRGLKQEEERQLQIQMADSFAAIIDNLTVQISSLEATETELESRREVVMEELQLRTAAVQQYERLSSERDLRNETRLGYEEDLSELRVLENRAGRVRVLSSPTVPDQISSPTLIPVVGGSVVLITGFVAGLIVLKEISEKRVRTPRDVSAIPGTRVLGVIPERSIDPSKPESIVAAAHGTGYGAVAESARSLRNEIFRACNARGHKTIMFVSGSPGAGSSSIVAAVGHTSAAVGKRTLIIDANFWKPDLAGLVNANASRGLSDLLQEGASDAQAVSESAQELASNLWCLSAGSSVPASREALTGAPGAAFFSALRDQYDIVLIDAPPATIGSDALAYATFVDASVLVCRAYQETRGLVQRVRHQLADAPADFLGVVVNAVRASAGGYYKENMKAAAAYESANRTSSSSAVGSLAS